MVTRDANGKFIKGQSGNPAGRPKKEREERFYEVAIQRWVDMTGGTPELITS